MDGNIKQIGKRTKLKQNNRQPMDNARIKALLQNKYLPPEG
jgi:hypothetical protein